MDEQHLDELINTQNVEKTDPKNAGSANPQQPQSIECGGSRNTNVAQARSVPPILYPLSHLPHLVRRNSLLSPNSQLSMYNTNSRIDGGTQKT